MENRYYRARKDQAPMIVTGRVYVAVPNEQNNTTVKLWDLQTRASVTLSRSVLADKSLFERLTDAEIRELPNVN